MGSEMLSMKWSTDMLSLKWNSHKNTFVDVLATAREKKTFCDATIACEGNLYPVHRFVISTCSTYFERILSNISDANPIIVLADIKAKDIADLLQYMYTGEVMVRQEDIDSFIKAGEVLRIKGIAVAEENEITKQQKRLFNDSEERPDKRQRTDEFSETLKQLNDLSREPEHIKETKDSSEIKDCNEKNNQQEINGSTGPSDQAISDYVAVKEEILQPSDDPLHLPAHSIKVEVNLNEAVTDEDNIIRENTQLICATTFPEHKLAISAEDEERSRVMSADSYNFERRSHNVIEQIITFPSNNSHDTATSSISTAQNNNSNWIMQNDFRRELTIAQENRSRDLTGWCLVCGDKGSGYHYGIETCMGCNAFFKRSIRKNIGMDYFCAIGGNCDISRASRWTRYCKACRFQKCLTAGMNVYNVRKSIF
ncbi:unnamed protein product [Meganyctiphanes norvegica]|uniref:Uncharacterized protein n=1 Tax=Meganyctiphanes norvegica TaxID=48144 RepID=A0AAV2SJY3_MEGNR